LIFHGRFLHGSVTLGALHLPVGSSTVMHLVNFNIYLIISINKYFKVARETLPEPNSSGIYKIKSIPKYS